MDTPIFDLVRSYGSTTNMRLHMPGHKGISLLGMETMDITEITGADSLYEAQGIIKRSEANASRLFGCPTFYSTEGSSQCIRAMLQLASVHAKGAPVIAAARNVHKTFLSAAALLDLPVRWLYPQGNDSHLSCPISPSQLDAFLEQERCTAVYVTSPDYLGHQLDIAALAQVCHRHGALLLVDSAHGAYLRFLEPSRHPMDLGADLCCASAHKTLPVLTGGAYLHIASHLPQLLRQAKDALALFGSTSPSYLILQSLDVANAYLSESYRPKLAEMTQALAALKHRLVDKGWHLLPGEPLKLTFLTKPSGYTGTELHQRLHRMGIECEFADPDHLVMMFTPENGTYCLKLLERALDSLGIRPPIVKAPPAPHRCTPVLSIRQAMLSPAVTLPVEQCVGQILAAPSVGCPPAVPILICGERIDEAAVEAFRYYGTDRCAVVANNDT